MKKYIFLSLIVFLFSCGESKQNEDDVIDNNPANQLILTNEQIELAGIETGKIEEKEISAKISCKGQIQATPQNRAKVSVPMEGYVKNIYVQNGQIINKGVAIATLQHPSYIELQKNYLQAKSKFDYMKLEYERQKTLFEQNASTSKIFEKTKSDYEELKSEVEAYKLQLQLISINAEKLTSENIRSTITVYAPITGNINQINISVGEFVSPDDVLFEMIGNNEFLLELQVFERDIQDISIGQTVVFTCSNSNSANITHSADIIYIGNFVDEATKTFKVQAKPRECSKEMRHGMYLNAEITLDNKPAFVLPETAIIQEGESYFIFPENNGVFSKAKIEIGRKDNGLVEIINAEKFLDQNITTIGTNYVYAELNKE